MSEAASFYYTDPSGHCPICGAILFGAIIGAISSGMQSDWDWKATLIGTGIGAVSGAVGGYVGGEAGALVGEEYGGIVGGAAGGAAAGATAGGMYSAIYGGNVGNAMLMGAGYGALGGAVFGAIGYPNSPWKVAAYTAIGGGLAELSGGDFAQGAMIAGGMALMGYGYYKFTDIGNGGRYPNGTLSDGTAMVKDNNPEIDLARMDANRNKSYFGSAATKVEDLSLPGHEGWSGFTWLTSHVPFANDIAYVHDFGWGRIFTNAHWNMVTNYGSMLPAAALTMGGASAYYAPLTNGINLGMKR